MIRTFGVGEATASRVVLAAAVNRLRGRAGRTVKVTKVAKRINQRGTVTTAEVVAVAQANPTLFTLSSANSLITLTGTGLRAARSRMTPRYAVR